MTGDGPAWEDGYEAALTEQYGRSELGDEILEALAGAGIDVDSLTRDDIASFEEFHIRGREATREVARLAGVGSGDRVLDVGCGVGGPARTLAAEFGCRVVGVDVVAAYCETAELFTERVGLEEGVRFRQGNALDLPFEADVFDVVWFAHTLMNVEETSRALSEARRVLKPGGRLVLYEICAGPGEDPVFPVPWADDPSLSFLERPAAFRDMILESDFELVAWEDVTAESLAWFRDVVESMQSRPPDAPEPLGLNLLMGESTPAKATNVVRNLESDSIRVVQAVFE